MIRYAPKWVASYNPTFQKKEPAHYWSE